MHAVLLFICFGGTTLQLVKCYSDGYFDDDVCQTMAVNHDQRPYQDSEPPFQIVPDNIFVEVSDIKLTFTVSLKANSIGQPFHGFLLEARQKDDGPPVGVFTLTDSSISRLQTCFGVSGSAVTQTDNQAKTEVTVNWSPPGSGLFFFRATFVENFEIFWPRKNITIPTTPGTGTSTPTSTPSPTAPPPVTSSQQTVPASASASASVSAQLSDPTTVTESPASTPSPTAPTSGFTSPKTPMEACSLLSPLLLLTDFFLLLILTKQVAAKVLTGLAVVLSLFQVIVIFLFRGPSDERRRPLCWTLGLVSFVNMCLSAAAVCVGFVVYRSSCVWLPGLLAVYLGCDLLFFIFCSAFKLNQKSLSGSCWCWTLVIGTVVNVAFTVALITGMFVCENT